MRCLNTLVLSSTPTTQALYDACNGGGIIEVQSVTNWRCTIFVCLICDRPCSLNPCDAICKECANGAYVQQRIVCDDVRRRTDSPVADPRSSSDLLGDQQDDGA